MDHNRKALGMWNGWFAGRGGVPKYDLWLDDYEAVLKKHRDDLIVDLGCGNGADTWYLLERGYHVLSCDYSKVGLGNVSRLPGAKTQFLDMNERFPFENNSVSVFVADISLHYFNDEKTIHVMEEIRRCLEPGGYLLARVSSENDVHYGAHSGIELEPRYRDLGAWAQRFMNEDDVCRYFGIIGHPDYRKKAMRRKNDGYYSQDKMLYQVCVSKEDNRKDADL